MVQSINLLKPSANLGLSRGYRTPAFPAPIDLALDGNEGRGVGANVLRILDGVDGEALRHYPVDRDLCADLGAFLGCAAENVMVTAGADDALERAIRAVVGPGDEVILPVPTFEMIGRYVSLAGGRCREVEWTGGPLPVGQMLALVSDRTRMICVVTPNSPTGLTASGEDLKRLSAQAPSCLLLVDLAYTEFADTDLTPVVLGLPNGVGTRTFSKAWGLAGARVGYAFGPGEVLEWMRAAGHPYAVSGISLSLARARLGTDRSEVNGFVERVKVEREELRRFLSQREVTAGPSQGNFVLARLKDAWALRQGLAREGIAVRAFPGKQYLEDALRITMPGKIEDFERLLAALGRLLDQEASK